MDDELIKVYALLDEQNRITAIEGGYSVQNITDLSKWTLIDEGEGDRYAHCQSQYLPKPLTDLRGIYRYVWKGTVIERTEAAMDADWESQPRPADISLEERIKDLEIAICELMDALA